MIIYSPNYRIAGNLPAPDFTIEETPLQGSPVIEQEIIGDINYEKSTATSSDNNFIIHVEVPPEVPVTFVSSNESVATVDSSGQVLRVLDGSVRIYVYAFGHSGTFYDRIMSSSGGSVVYTPLNFIAGTLGLSAQTETEGLISGLSPGDAGQQYIESSNGDVDNPIVTLRTGTFINPVVDPIDFSGISVITGNKGNDRSPVTIVTDRHALVAKHVSNFNSYAFKKSDGNYQTLTVASRTDTSGADLTVVYFNEDIDPLIKRYSVMPADWVTTYVPSLDLNATPSGVFSALPILRKAVHSVTGVSGISSFLINSYYYFNNLVNLSWNATDAIGLLAGWGYPPSSGDSGGPSFVMINGEPVLLGSQYTTGEVQEISQYIPEINSIMTTQAGSAYALTEFDLASEGFVTFP